jgi:hypothetical protein
VCIEQWKIKLEEEANGEIASANNGIWYCVYFGEEGEETMDNLRRRKGEERKRRRKEEEEGEEENRE